MHRRLHSFSRGNSSENLNIDNYNNKRLLQKAFYQEFELAQTLVDESKRQVLRGNKIKHGGGRKYVNVRTMDFDSWGNKLIQVETTEKFKRGATVPYETECYSRKLYSSKTGKVTFELTVGNYDWGVRHYDKDGNDDTKTYLKHLKLNINNNKLSNVRKKLANKIDKSVGINLSNIKLPIGTKIIEAKISKFFDTSNR